MVDTINADVSNLPRNLPIVAGYTTGTPDIQWTSDSWGRFKGRKVRIDQSDSMYPLSGDVKDIELGASMITTAVVWARTRATKGLHSVFYIRRDSLDEARLQVRNAGLTAYVHYWVADWNLNQIEAEAFIMENRDVCAVQWASPTTNPHTVIPGTRSLTLSETNADLSVVADWWLSAPPRRHPVRPHPKVVGGTTGAAVGVGITELLRALGVHVDPVLAGAISTLAGAIAGYLSPAGRTATIR